MRHRDAQRDVASGFVADCVFCGIARNQVRAAFVHEEAEVVAFLDRSPIRRGHAQIIPRLHYETFEQLPEPLASRILAIGQDLARRMKALYAVDRVAFVFTGGDVPHAHAHVVPMVEPTDITSGRYMLEPRPRLSSAHLRTDLRRLRTVAAELKAAPVDRLETATVPAPPLEGKPAEA